MVRPSEKERLRPLARTLREGGRRAVNIPLFLTQKGVETAKGIVEKIDRIVESAGEGVTQKNREIFYETLQIISTNLQRMCDKYGEEL